MIRALVTTFALALSLQAQAFTFGINCDVMNLIPEAEIKKGFEQHHHGEIRNIMLIEDGENKYYRLRVTVPNGDAWTYEYDAITGKLIDRKPA